MRTIRTAKNRATFLDALVESGGHVTAACARAGISRVAAYAWRKADPDFAAAWQEALDRGADVLEDEAIRRAVQGVDEPVFYQGVQVATVRRYSDTLLMFLLKGRRPERYKERMEHSGDAANPIVHRHELNAALERAIARAEELRREAAGRDGDADASH